MSKAIEISPLVELRQIFESNKGADSTLVISKRLAEQLLAALAVERQEPVAFRYKKSWHKEFWSVSPVEPIEAFNLDEETHVVEPLYTSPPVPVAVVLPNLEQVNTWMTECGWQNSVLRQADLPKIARVLKLAFDKIKELNNAQQ